MHDAASGLSPAPSDNLWHAILGFFISIGAFLQGWSFQDTTLVTSFICSATGFLCGVTVLCRFYWDWQSRKKLRKNEVLNHAKRRRQS